MSAAGRERRCGGGRAAEPVRPDFARESLHAATHNVFVAPTAPAALIAVAVAFVPRRAEQLVFGDDAAW